MKRILIVDDDVNLATIFATALKASDLEVEMANDAHSGIEKATSGHFDLVLLDQVMPDMKGNDVLKALKANEETKDVPIVMLTNFAHDNMVQDALNAGAKEYILKYQVSTDDLVSKVKSIVGES